MRKVDVAPDLSALAFDFFYWFSRFEFALKEHAYLKSHAAGANAEPGWDEFVKKWEVEYSASDEAVTLMAAKPEQQIVAANHDLEWKSVDLAACKSELARVVRLLKTVRNNLFTEASTAAQVGMTQREPNYCSLPARPCSTNSRALHRLRPITRSTTDEVFLSQG